MTANTSDYDEFVNWRARLDREAPFFKREFSAVGAQSVLDVGAGSARHAVLFAMWGKRVVAVDPDDSMLAKARENIDAAAADIEKARGSIELMEGGFGDLSGLLPDPVDALVCTGNALPHVGGLTGLRATLADFAAVVRPGGALILHLLNHARLMETKPRAIAPVVRDTDSGTKVFLRVIGYPEGEDALDFDFVTLVRDEEGDWSLSHRRSLHTALPVRTLERELRAAGFTKVTAYGDHSGRILDVAADESVIVTARRERSA